MDLSCRFYNGKFPQIGDVVMVRIHSVVTNLAIYVKLLEYDSIDGMIPWNEISKRRITYSLTSFVGRNDCVKVTWVDIDKGIVECSKARVDLEEVAQCQERYAKAKQIHGVMKRVADLLGVGTADDFQELYRRAVWHFEEKYGDKMAAFRVFHQSVLKPETLYECDLNRTQYEVLISEIQKRFSPKPVKIEAEIAITCFTNEGIDAIKRALKEGQKSSGNSSIKVTLADHSHYSVVASSVDKDKAVSVVSAALTSIEHSIRESGGGFKVIKKPTPVSRPNGALINCNEDHNHNFSHQDVSNGQNDTDLDFVFCKLDLS